MELTRDAFLGGRVMAWQPRTGYRAATDPVLLAAACAAGPGETVLDLGCGAGVASLCLAARVPGVVPTGVEIQPAYADLARRNAAEAGLAMEVATADLSDLPDPIRGRAFDHAIANPPFFRAGPPAPDAGRATARHEATPLGDWILAARRRLRPRGWLTIILPAARLPDLIAALAEGWGDIALRPLAPRAGREAGRVILRARKGGRGPFRLCPPLVMHAGQAHAGDRDDYTPEASAILRDAAPLGWPGPGD